jgi:hypothetical protein
MKTTSKLIFFIFALLALAASAYAQFSREQIDISGNPLLDFFLQQGGAVALAIIIAAVTAVITYRSERLKQRRESKIRAYEAMMNSIGVYIRAGTDAEKKAAALDKFSDASMIFCVWADKAVLAALSEYMRNSTNIADTSKRTNVVLLRNNFVRLMAAIREDIGFKSAVDDAVGTISFGDEWEKTPSAVSAQIPNPLFVEAQDISQQLNSSTLNDNDKTEWVKRFHDLEQEQQLLWCLAKQVDSGQCTVSCIDLYNSRVVAWESSLQNFIHDARLVAEQIRLV